MRAPLIAGIVALILVAGGIWSFLAGSRRNAPVIATVPAPAEATHLSISGAAPSQISPAIETGQDYFADGITENLTTDLSRIRKSFVIARNTAFTFKGKTIDAKEIGKELGVRYVLEGSDATRPESGAGQRPADRLLKSGAHLLGRPLRAKT